MSKLNIVNIQSDSIRYESECCQAPLNPYDGDCLIHPPVNVAEDQKGLGWSFHVWHCSKCSKRHTTISLAIASNPVDKHIAYDGYHEAERDQLLFISDSKFKVFGEESFNVTHENPEADFAERKYDKLCEYTFGPYLELKMAEDAVKAMYEQLVQRVQK